MSTNTTAPPMTADIAEGTGPLYLSRLRLNLRHPRIQRTIGDAQALHQLVMALFPTMESERARAAMSVLHRLDEAQPKPGVVATPSMRSDDPVLIVQSAIPPRLDGPESGWFAEMLADGLGSEALVTRDVGPTFAGILDGQRLGFRLRANPTKRLSLQRPDDPDHWAGPTDTLLARHRADGKGTGPRVALLREAEQLDWLARQGERHGFRLLLQERTWTPGGAADGSTAGDTPDAGPLYAVRTAKQTMRGRRGKAPLTHLAVTFDGELTVTDADRFRAALRDGIGPARAYGFGLLSVRRPR